MRRLLLAAAAAMAFTMSASAEPSTDQRRAFAFAREAAEAERAANPEQWFTEALGIVTAQIASGDVAGAQPLMAQMLSEAPRGEDQERRDDRLGYVAELQARAGLTAQSQRTLARIDRAPRRVEIPGRIAAGHAAQGQTEAARAALGETPEGEARDNAVATAVQWAVNAGHFATARALAEAFAMPYVEQIIANHAAREGDDVTARAALARLPSERRLDVLYELGCAHLEAGRREAGRAVMLEARDAWRSRPADDITRIYAKMLAEELSRAGEYAAALELVPYADTDQQGELYQLISGNQAWAGLSADAARTLTLIDRGELFRVTEGRASIVAARVGHGLERPEALMRFEGALSLEDYARDAAAEAVEHGHGELARDLLRRVAQSRDDESLIWTVESQVTLGFLDDARATAASMRRNDLRADAFGTVAKALAGRGDRTGALAAFAEAQLAGRSLAPDDYAFITEEMAEVGYLTEALAAARALPSGNFDRDWARGRAFRAIAVAYARAGDADTAFAVVREAPMARADAFVEVANALAD